MELKKRRRKVLHLDRNNPVHRTMLGAVWLESSFAERVLQILVDNKLSMKNSEVPLWQRGPVVFQGALGRDL